MSDTSSKKVVANSIIYSVSGLLLKCFSLFLLPLYTIYLTTEDYGITSVATSFAATMGYVVSLSLFSAVMRFYVDLKDDPKKLSRFYGTVVVFSLLSSILWGCVMTIFREPISHYIFSGVDYYPVILICLATLVFNVQHTIYTNILKSQQKALKSSILSIGYFFFTLVLNILFVVVLKKGAVGVLCASLIADGVFFLVFMLDMLRQKAISICLDFTMLKDALKYSIPIMPHNLSTQIAMLVSKALIGGSASLASLGLYSVASQFGNMADTIQSYVNNAYAPWLYEKLHSREQSYKITIRKTVNLLSAVLGLFLIGIALFAQDYILLFLEKSYCQAWRYVPLIVLVFAIKTMYYFYVNVLFYYKKASRLLFTATLTGSIINVALSSVMIPWLGAYGSILADAIAMVVRVAIITAISLRYENVGLHIRDFVLNFILVVGFIVAAMLPSYLKADNIFTLLNLGYKALIMIAYMFVIYIQNRTQIQGFVSNILEKRKGRA